MDDQDQGSQEAHHVVSGGRPSTVQLGVRTHDPVEEREVEEDQGLQPELVHREPKDPGVRLLWCVYVCMCRVLTHCVSCG